MDFQKIALDNGILTRTFKNKAYEFHMCIKCDRIFLTKLSLTRHISDEHFTDIGKRIKRKREVEESPKIDTFDNPASKRRKLFTPKIMDED